MTSICEIGNYFWDNPIISQKKHRVHGKKFGADAAPSGRFVTFNGGELWNYTFGYAALHSLCG